MIEDEVEKALNDQINAEFYSAYLYLSMATDFQEKGLDGFANWMRAQAKEETDHAMRIFDFLEERGGRVELQSIDEPQKEWESPLEAFKDAYEHEKYVTEKIHDLVELAEDKGDRATENMLQWFVEEQVEEEESVNEIVQKIEMVEEDPSGLLMVNSELGQRTEMNQEETAEGAEESGD